MAPQIAVYFSLEAFLCKASGVFGHPAVTLDEIRVQFRPWDLSGALSGRLGNARISFGLRSWLHSEYAIMRLSYGGSECFGIRAVIGAVLMLQSAGRCQGRPV